MSDSSEKNDHWVPEGMTQVGNYAFAEPFVPTLEQVEESEEFIFGDARFFDLDESLRRRNVIRLAIMCAAEWIVPEEEGSTAEKLIPLIGGQIVKVTATRHDGSVVRTYGFME